MPRSFVRPRLRALSRSAVTSALDARPAVTLTLPTRPLSHADNRLIAPRGIADDRHEPPGRGCPAPVLTGQRIEWISSPVGSVGSVGSVCTGPVRIDWIKLVGC